VKRSGLMLVAVILAAWFAASAQALTVGLDRSSVETNIGHRFTFVSTIANTGSTTESGLVAHLNVLSDDPGVYVDPEDWSSHRTRYLAPIPPHGSTTVTWRVKAVNAGSIGVYVAVVPESGSSVRPAAGPMVHASITDRRSLNSGGIAPLALGVPLVLVGLLVVVRVRRRAH